MRGHSPAPRGLLTALLEALSGVSLLPCLCVQEGRLVVGPPGAARHGLCLSWETAWSPGEGEVSPASCLGMNSICHPAHRALVNVPGWR